MNPLSRFLRHYLLALQFFTRIPVTGPLAEWVGFSPDMLRASAGHFPGVGWLVGGLLAGLNVHRGKVTSQAVAESLGLDFVTPESALAA
jgi:cobalamin synthase